MGNRYSQEFVKKNLGPDIELLKPYRSKAIKMELQCLKCTHKWTRFFHVDHMIACPKCHIRPNRGRLKITFKELSDRYQKKDIELIEWHHDRADNKNFLRCNSCQYEWVYKHDKTPDCPECKRIEKEEGIRLASEKKATEDLATKHIQLISTFKWHQLLTFLCKTCDNQWEAFYTPTVTCQKCRVPSGRLPKEDTISNFKKKGITLVEWYVDRDDNRNLIKCESCGDEWATSDKSGNRKGGCTQCGNRSKRGSQEQVEQEYRKAGIKLLSTYTRSNHFNELECMTCGFQWKGLRASLLNFGSGCPKCYPSKKEIARCEAESRLKRSIVGNIILRTLYKNKRTQLELKCTDCDHEWAQYPYNCSRNNHLSCPQCGLKKNQLSYEEIENDYKLKNILLIQCHRERGDGKNLLKCQICYYEWSQYHGNRKKAGCPKCAKQAPLTTENVRSDYDKLEINLLSEVINSDTYITLECRRCGHVWDTKPAKRGCPSCNTGGYFGQKFSREGLCRDILEKITGARFPKKRPPGLINPKTKARLELDGLSEIGIAFEYQGQHHYLKNINYREHTAFSRESIEQTREKDEIKRQFCKELGIKLIEIPYWIKPNKLEEFIKGSI